MREVDALNDACLEAGEIQGLVFSSYTDLPETAYVLAQIDDAAAAREWFGHIHERITTGRPLEADCALNVAFTTRGLRTLGLADAVIEQFSSPFVEGMADSAHRSRILADCGDSDPESWAWGGPGSPIGVLILVSRATARSPVSSWTSCPCQALLQQRTACACGMCSGGISSKTVVAMLVSILDFVMGFQTPYSRGCRPRRRQSTGLPPESCARLSGWFRADRHGANGFDGT